MPKLSKNALPAYRRHKQSGQAIVTLSGKDFLLGPQGSAASHGEYNRLVAEWVANGRSLPAPGQVGLTVNELILRYWRYAKSYYQKNGQATSEVDSIKSAITPLKQLYGATLAADFRPLALQALREKMIQKKWARGTINDQIARIKRCFKWAVAQELVPPDLHHGLCAVTGLKKNRSTARETDPMKPVQKESILAVIRTLSPSLAELLDLQEMIPADAADAALSQAKAQKLAALVREESCP